MGGSQGSESSGGAPLRVRRERKAGRAPLPACLPSAGQARAQEGAGADVSPAAPPLHPPQVEVSAASNALGQCGGKLRRLELVESFSPEGQRTAVVVAKVGATPKRYPRQPGTPNKKPL